MFDGDCFMVCRFLGLRIINSFTNRMLRPTARPSGQNAEIHARMRGRQKPSSTGASGATRVFQHEILLRRHEKCLDATKKTSSSLIGYVGKNPGSNSLKQAAYFLGWRFFLKSEYQIGLGILYPPKHQKRVDHD